MESKADQKWYFSVIDVIVVLTQSQDPKDYSPSQNETEEAILLNDTRAVLNHAISMLPPQQREV